MSRTTRRIVWRSHRNMRVQARRKTECAAFESIQNESLKCRHYNRLQNYMGVIPNPWDDYPVSAHSEFTNKSFWSKWCEERKAEIDNRGNRDNELFHVINQDGGYDYEFLFE